jgi:hypothetical protein
VANSRRYWISGNGKNMRRFFEDFAKRRNFDPLVPENWYLVDKSDILEEKVLFFLFFFLSFSFPFSLSSTSFLLFAFPPSLLFFRHIHNLNSQGVDSFLLHFKRNHIKALLHLFPDIGLDEKKFTSLPGNSSLFSSLF